MSISFNGSQITYPDGSIQVSSTKVMNVTRITYNVRTAWSDNSAAEIWTPAFTKLYSDTKLYVEVDLSMRNNYSDCLVHEMNYAEGTWYQGTQPYDAGFTANSRPYHSTFLITSSATGSNTLRLRWRTNNVQAGNKPATVWNPNSSDDARYNQEYSAMTVWELRGV